MRLICRQSMWQELNTERMRCHNHSLSILFVMISARNVAQLLWWRHLWNHWQPILQMIVKWKSFFFIPIISLRILYPPLILHNQRVVFECKAYVYLVFVKQSKAKGNHSLIPYQPKRTEKSLLHFTWTHWTHPNHRSIYSCWCLVYNVWRLIFIKPGTRLAIRHVFYHHHHPPPTTRIASRSIWVLSLSWNLPEIRVYVLKGLVKWSRSVSKCSLRISSAYQQTIFVWWESLRGQRSLT